MVTPQLFAEWPFFAGLHETHIAQLATLADYLCFPQGHVIFRQGDPAAYLYVLTQGWVDLTAVSDARSGWQELVMTLSQGEVLGWSAVVEPYIYTASAQCITPVTLVAFPGEDLRALLVTDAQLCYTLMNRICCVIARRLEATRAQLVSDFMSR